MTHDSSRYDKQDFTAKPDKPRWRWSWSHTGSGVRVGDWCSDGAERDELRARPTLHLVKDALPDRSVGSGGFISATRNQGDGLVDSGTGSPSRPIREREQRRGRK